MKKARIWFLAVFAASLLLCFVTYFNVIVPADTFHWDESHHAMYGVWLTKDIQAGNWDSFWANTNRQTLWPFFHSWYLTCFFLLFGISYVVARTANLFAFFLLLLAMWWVGRELDGKKTEALGLLSWGLTATAALFWIRGSENMIEVLGALLTLGSIYFLFKLDRTSKWEWIAPLGITMSVLMVTKYNYAVFVYAAVALWAAFELVLIIVDRKLPEATLSKKRNKKEKKPSTTEWRIKGIKEYFIKYVLVGLPSLLMFLWWMYGENSERKWQMIFYSKSEYVEKAWQVPGFINNFLYYFKQTIIYYTWFPPIGFLIILGMIGIVYLAIKKDRTAQMLAVFTWVSMYLAIFIFMNKLERYIFSFVPILLLAAAYFWTTIWEEARTKIGTSKFRILSFGTLIIMLLIVVLGARPMMGFFAGKGMMDQDRGYWLPQKTNGVGMIDVLDYYLAKVPSQSPMACGLAFETASPYVFYFHFINRAGPFYNLYSLNQAQFYKGMYLITMKLQADSPYFKQINEHSLQNWNSFIDKNRAHLELVESKEFSQLKLTAEIYVIK